MPDGGFDGYARDWTFPVRAGRWDSEAQRKSAPHPSEERTESIELTPRHEHFSVTALACSA